MPEIQEIVSENFHIFYPPLTNFHIVDGGLAEHIACADPGARTPIGAGGNGTTITFGGTKRLDKTILNLTKG